VVTVAGGLLTAASGSGGTNAAGGAYVPVDPGLLGPVIGFGGASIGQTTTAGETVATFIGQAGGAQQGTGVTLGPDNTSVGGYYYRYNFVNGEHAAAAYTSSNHVNTANGEVCAIDLGQGGCIGLFNTSGPAGTTVGQRVLVLTPYYYFQLIMVNGQPTSIWTNLPLPVSP
jgi:hypothetical protein